jgi:hypothetical protein
VANLDSYAGPVWLATVTAPGREALRHDENGRVSWVAAYGFNKNAPHYWRRLYHRAQQETRREVGRRANVLAWVWQYQKRGVLHKHLILGVGSAIERAAADAFIRWLGRLSKECKFGYVDRGKWDYKRRRRCLREMTGKHAGRYVAKYLVQRLPDGRYAVSETVTHDDVPPLVVYVARSLTDGTGITMRALREWRCFVVTAIPVTLEFVRASCGPEYRQQLDEMIAARDAAQRAGRPAPPQLRFVVREAVVV